MIQLTPQHKILVYPEHIDFRKGIDKIIGFSRAYLNCNPLSGAFFAGQPRSRFNEYTRTATDGLPGAGGHRFCHGPTI